MAVVTRALFAAVLTTDYPSVLASGQGSLLARRDHALLFGRRSAEGLVLPWEQASDWNFWAPYMRGVPATRDASADAAWERVVPLCRLEVPLNGPEGTTASADVFVYPSVISVVVRVHAEGAWPLELLGTRLGELRQGRGWSLADGAPRQTIDGIAHALRDSAASMLAAPTPPSGTETKLTVAAPVQADGSEKDFALSNPLAAACLVGLASLGPPGPAAPFSDTDPHALDRNTATRASARIYVIEQGHAFWSEEGILGPADRLVCLHQNQTDLVTHIAALERMVTWAAGQCEAGTQIPDRSQEIVRKAAQRLDQLYAGDRGKTYRSKIAQIRVAPLRPSIQRIADCLGGWSSN